MSENHKIRAQSFKELLFSFQIAAVFQSFISYNCILMCFAFFYFRLTNVSILHSSEFEFTLFYHYFFLYLCLLYPRCILGAFIQCTSNCKTKPYFVLFFNLHLCLARRLSLPWSLEHTSWEHIALCVSKNFCKNHCICNVILFICFCVTCHGNKILLRRQLTYKSICRCNVLPPHDVVVTCHRVVCLRE